MLLGADIVKSKKGKEPDNEGCGKIFDRIKDLGVLIGKGGSFGNVLRIKPPMIINEKDVEFALECIDVALTEYQEGKL